MAMEIPPPFQEAPCCAVCFSTFSTFKRRHHCRRCGRSLCSEHSSSHMALPQFGISSAVRVCNDCYEAARQNFEPPVTSNSEEESIGVTTSVSRLSLISDDNPTLGSGSPVVSSNPVTSIGNQILNCTCGMPLCICQAPVIPEIETPTETVAPVKSKKSSSSATSMVFPSRPSASSQGNNLPSLFFASGQTTNGYDNSPAKNYEPTGEGMREAIKNGDVETVKHLLMNGVDPNYFDKQGMSLLHLAAVFNLTDVTFLLMEAGAKVDAKNGQGETPLDCAQAMLQYKMRQKIKTMAGN